MSRNGPSEAPPGTWLPARRAALKLLRPVERFLHVEAASGIILLVVTVIALAWANSRWAASYEHLWHTPVTFGIGPYTFQKDLHFWINDGLMTIFFFVVGLEIRRETHQGELSDLKRAALPIAAAIGGMAAPALIYLALNPHAPERQGWAIPTATDIAFAVGVLALLGKRVPSALRVLLLALAIIDDIGAIVIIAIFYSSGISLVGFGVAGLGIAAVLLMQRFGVRSPLAYVPAGVVLFAGLLIAGVHPTIAGVVLGLLTPVRPWYDPEDFVSVAGEAIGDYRRRAEQEADPRALTEPLAQLRRARREAVAPVVRIEAALHPWVAYGIMPVFALANAGVSLGGVRFDEGGATGMLLGVAVGLAVGKPAGILAASYAAVKLGIASLPRGVTWSGVLVVGCVGGIGFTMAIFIAGLAFGSAANLGVAKLAVLIGSLAAILMAMLLGRLLLPRTHAPEVEETSPGEAESSTEF